MTYILIIIGFTLIYLSTRNSKSSNEDNSNNEFSKILDEKIYNEDIDQLKEHFREILSRIENLENSIILIDNQIGIKTEEDKNKPDLIEDSSNILDVSADNYTERDLNTLIFQLKDEGKDLDEICSTLKLGKGEVLLRLGLRK